MPIIDYIKDDFTEIVTWYTSEPIEELLKKVRMTPERMNKLELLRPKQAKEYLGLRAGLLTLKSDLDVYYNDLGKPYIDSNHHLSITHSYGMVSVALSHFPIGIDIEKRRDDKIKNIAHKFVREDEFSWIPKNDFHVDYLHIIWGIKEGLYKLNGGNLWNFLHHYKVEKFELTENKKIICWIYDEVSSEKYFAYFKMIENFFLIWVLDYEG